MTCIPDTGFFYCLNIFNSNFVFLKKALVTTRSLICIRIQVGRSSSLCYPGGKQHMTQPLVFNDVCPSCTWGKWKGPQLLRIRYSASACTPLCDSPQGLAPSSMPREEHRAQNLTHVGFQMGTLRMRQALQSPKGKGGDDITSWKHPGSK